MDIRLAQITLPIFLGHGVKLTKKTLKNGTIPSQNFPVRSHSQVISKTRNPRNIAENYRPTEEAIFCYKNFQDFNDRLQNLTIKRDWIILHKEKGKLLQFYDDKYSLPQFEIFIDHDLNYTILVYNWLLPDEHLLYKSYKRNLRNVTISNLVNHIKKLNICNGIDHEHFITNVNSVNHCLPVAIDYNDLDEFCSSTRFMTETTSRSINCHVLLEKILNCDECQKSQKLSEAKLYRKNTRKSEPAKLKAPISSTSAVRLKLAMQDHRLKCQQLEEELRKMKIELKSNSLDISEDLNNDLLAIIDENNTKFTPFMKLFWEEQKKNLNAVATGRRYHPMIIRWCMSISAKSASAYDELRKTFNNSGTITLPSRRTLRDYSNAVKPAAGFNSSIIKLITEEATHLKDFQRFVVLLYDEMTIKHDLVWDKHTGELIGYVNLGDPEINYLSFNECNTIASHILAFMINSIAGNFRFVLGYFATNSLKSVQLFNLFWKAIGILTLTCKLKVVAATGDGASVNRKFIKMHSDIMDTGTSNVIYKTHNLFAPDEFIYFFSDAPHLIKTSRNCLYNSGSGKKSRYLWNGMDMQWNHITNMFFKDLDNGLHLLPKLKLEAVLLDSYSIMRVDYAAKVLSATVAAVLKKFGGPECTATSKFCEMLDKFFDCFNVRSLQEGKRNKKLFLMPYTNQNDERIFWLNNVFLSYLEEWQCNIQNRDGSYTSSAKTKMFISPQTFEGIKMSILSLSEVIPHLLNNGCSFVFSNRFCQDKLEEYFGKQRGIGHRSNNPNVKNFGYNENKIRISRENNKILGNTRGALHSSDVDICNIPLSRRQNKTVTNV